MTDKTKGELQAVIDAQRQAIVKRDLSAYQSTYDGQRGALRRCKQETFDTAGRQGAASPYTVLKVEPYPGGTYVRAWVDEIRGVARYYFRKVEGKWVQSEPTESEAGPERKTTIDGIDVEYWAVDDDMIGVLGNAVRQARDTILQNLLSDRKTPFSVRFYGTRSLATVVGCRVAGTHLANTPSDPFLRIYIYWFTPDMKALTDESVGFIQHEGLHWAQDQFIPGIAARTDWWLTEGWPDYVGKARSTGAVRSAICTTKTPTFKQLVDGPPDLPETPPEEAPRYYAFANSMVEYLYAQFGSDAYKQLLTVYKEGVDPNVNYPKVLKVTPDQFYTGWLAFAKKKYC